MENPTQPNSDGTTPTHNPTDREAFAMIRSLISEGHETNHERSKFAHNADELEAVENESRALDRLNAWLNAKERDALTALFKPDLSRVSVEYLAAELTRRERVGECAFVIITPEDVREQWRTNQDADGTDEPAPTDDEARAALRLIQRYLDKTVHENEPAFEWGPTSDACELVARWRKEGGAK